jgi:hypothetical protein
VVALEHVPEPERRWLVEHCAAVLFPSVSEGFGLPPFEAAHHGVPCLFAAWTAMAELLPHEAATIVPWDAAASAERALALLTDAQARAEHVGLLQDAARGLTWRRTAEQLVEVYERAVATPAPAAAALAWEATQREQDLISMHDYQLDLRSQLDGFGDDGRRLVGRDGMLPADVQRALLAVAARRPVRRPLFALLRAGYALAHRRG